MNKEIIEKLADIEHQRWADWQKYMMLSCFKVKGMLGDNIVFEIPKAQWDNWHRQIMTPYKDLTEKEKDSDREQVDRYLPIIQTILDKQKEDIKEKIETIEELKNYINQIDNEEWIKIGYNQIPQGLFEKYGVKPFEIMKRKMRNNKGEVWNNINYFDAQKECKNLGYRLPNIQETLMLLEFYKQQNKEVSIHDKEFLGIEELSYDEEVYLEWIYCLDDCGFIRGGTWSDGSDAGLFALDLSYAPSNTNYSIGFRCVK